MVLGKKANSNKMERVSAVTPYNPSESYIAGIIADARGGIEAFTKRKFTTFKPTHYIKEVCFKNNLFIYLFIFSFFYFDLLVNL